MILMQKNQESLREYIEIPKYFSTKLIDSELLCSFLKQSSMSKNKINMDSLRNFYRKDRIKGEELISELKLRGFRFIFTSENNFISNIELKEDSEIRLIITNSNSNKFKNINRDIFYNLNYERIKSDFYFNLIPLHAFHSDPLLVEKEFIRYGFEIIKLDNLEEYILISSKIKDVDSSKNEDYEKNKKYKRLCLKEVRELNQEKFFKINNYLKNKDIKYLDELINVDFTKLIDEDESRIKMKIYLDVFQKLVKENQDLHKLDPVYTSKDATKFIGVSSDSKKMETINKDKKLTENRIDIFTKTDNLRNKETILKINETLDSNNSKNKSLKKDLNDEKSDKFAITTELDKKDDVHKHVRTGNNINLIKTQYKLIEDLKSLTNNNINIIINLLTENNYFYINQLKGFNYNNLLILDQINIYDVNEFKEIVYQAKANPNISN